MRFPRLYAALAVIGSLLLVACDEQNEEGAAPPPPEVTVATPLTKTVADWDGFVGQFEAVEHVELRPRVSGYLVDAAFEEGELVEEGDVLFTIDPRPFEAELSAARSRVRSAETRLDNARKELERARGLRDMEAVSQEELDSLDAAVQTAESDLEAARSGMQTAALDLEFTEVKAPVAGRVSYRRVDVGNAVVADSTLLTTLVSVDPIHFTFQGSEALYLEYRRQSPDSLEGAPVRIRIQGEDDYDWHGELTFMDNSLNADAGTIRGQAIVENPDGFLVPGMYGQLELQAAPEYEGVLLPDSAIGTRGAERIVYVVDDENTIQTRVVELGPLNEGLRVIRSGLEGSERVVINGLQRAFPGTEVSPTSGEIDDPAA